MSHLITTCQGWCGARPGRSYSGRAGAIPPSPRRPRLEDLDMHKYRQAGFGIGILTKLGDFSYPTGEAAETPEEQGWRIIRPIDEVVHEVKDMEQRFGLRKVFFVDNAFNIPLDHAKSLCRALTEADLKLHWNTCLAPFNCGRGTGGPDEGRRLRLGHHGARQRRRPRRDAAGRKPGAAAPDLPVVRRRGLALHLFPELRRTGGDP